MKLLKKTIVIVLVMVLLLTMFTACGKTSPKGKYYIKSVNGTPIEEFITNGLGSSTTIEQFLKECGIDSVDEYMVCEFKSDGTMIQYSPAYPAPQEGTWKQEGDEIIMTQDGQSGRGTIKGKEFSYTTATFGNTEGYQLVFIKKK